MAEPTVKGTNEIQEMFDSVDVKGTGKITEKQVYQLIQDCGMKQSYRVLIMTAFDKGHKGYLDFDDFTEYINCLNNLHSNPKILLRKIFDGLDRDGQGKLNSEQAAKFSAMVRTVLVRQQKQSNDPSSSKDVLLSFEELCETLGYKE